MTRRTHGSPLVLVIALMLCVIGTGAAYARAQPDQYTSTAVVSLIPRDAAQVGFDDLNLAASRYVAYLSAPATYARVAGEVGETLATLRATTNVMLQPATVNIEITVVGGAPERTAAIANALAAAGIGQSASDGQVTAEEIVPAVVPSAPSGPPRRLLVLGGGGIALVLAVLGVAAMGYLRGSRPFGGPVPVRLVVRAG